MDIKGKVVGFGITGSHCTYADAFCPQVFSCVPMYR